MLTKEAIQELMEPQAINAAATALQLAVSDFIANGEDTRGVVALPKDFVVTDLEQYLPERRRARGTMNTSSVDSFVGYTDAHGREGKAAVFVDAPRMRVVAVLNLGNDEDGCGHGDNRAVYQPIQTAAYAALLQISGAPKTQTEIAEWMEDWAHTITPRSSDDLVIQTKHAIDAVRRITVTEHRAVESEATNLSVSRSTLEQVAARGASTNLPTFIDVFAMPYAGLQERRFTLRLSVITTGKDPMLRLRIVKFEEHVEQMADELLAQVEAAMRGRRPAYIGSYEPLK